MRRFLRYVSLLLSAAVALLLVSAVAGYRAVQHQPEFYRTALADEASRQEVTGEQFERRVLEMRNDARRAGRWTTRITAEQINGWLASDLPEKFGTRLPREIRDPRVALYQDEAWIACRFEGNGVSSVISLAVDVRLTERTNELALRIRRARAGALPLPMKRLLDEARGASARLKIPLRWTQDAGSPVALLRLPEQLEGVPQRHLRLESVELRDGELLISGLTCQDGEP